MQTEQPGPLRRAITVAGAGGWVARRVSALPLSAPSLMLTAMNRIDRIFAQARSRGGKALMPFLTAGDPDLATTAALLPALEKAGAAICELGFPFSDPIADGPVIQASMMHALAQGVRPGQILEQVAQVRSSLQLGLVAMVSVSIVQRLGPERFVADAGRAGIDGFIFPDLPVEEADELRGLAADAGLTCSFLVAPTSDDARAERIARASTGFVYVLARSGVTGERGEIPADLAARLRRLRQATSLPLAVGFGVSTAEQVRQVTAHADAAIVGSAIMRRIAEHRGAGQAEITEHVGRFVRELAGGLAAGEPRARA